MNAYSLIQATANVQSVLLVPECKNEICSGCMLKFYVAFEQLSLISQARHWFSTSHSFHIGSYLMGTGRKGAEM
jgi:hypothetical protein